MKKHIFTLTALSAVLALAVMPSCKKNDSSKSRSEMIVGSWQTYQEGEDSNNNGVWDANEHIDLDSNDKVTFAFNAGGTGTASVSYLPTPVVTNWSLPNNENDIRIILTIPGMSSDTLSGNIVSFTESEVVIKDASATPVSFLSLKKR